ncbi:MAG: hypothetical protein KDD53_06820, partial [Bdellovibrionales bacterium]|nr:hypothetical protein [Bdellovibrionales bacterium]
MRDVVSSELPAIGRGPSRDVFEVLMPSHDDMIETLEHEMRRGGVDAFKFRNPRLTLAQAERLCERLQDSELHGIYPFDLPGTQKVWEGVDHRGVSYRQIATRQYLERHYGSSETDADFRSIEGFRRVLREFTYSHFTSEPINRFGTRLAGMAQYFAPAPHLGQTCVLEVVHGDPELSEVRAFGVSVADFTYSGEYSDKSGAPLPSTLSALKSLVCSIAGIYEEETGTTLDIRRPEDFAKILPRLTRTAFSTVPVSNWGTTIDGILDSVLYRSDAPSAYLDLISRDEDFVAIRKIGIREWDFQSPNETWSIRNASGVLEPTELAREFTGTLIKQLGEKLGVDPTSPMGFREVLARLKTDTYQKTKVGFWGTTGMSCLRQAYGGSVSAAVLDLISTAPQYFQIRLIGILPEDFPRAPNNYWKDPAGNPSANARRIMLRWLAMIARDQGLDLETEEGVVKAQKYISPKRARKAELNFWGTTPFGVLQSAYDGESKSVIDDLRSNGSKIG